MKRSGDTEPEPPGGRAAERLRSMLVGRYPQPPEAVEPQVSDKQAGCASAEEKSNSSSGSKKPDKKNK